MEVVSQNKSSQVFKAAENWSKLLISLATGSLVLSATFLKDLYQGHALHLLLSSWSLFAASVFFGMMAIGEIISQIEDGGEAKRGKFLEVLSLIQAITFWVAVILFLIFAARNVPGVPARAS